MELSNIKSEQINELTKALAKAQLAFKPVTKTADNPFFKSKYAPLDVVIEATKEGLSKNGLSVSQLPVDQKIITILMHESGQYIMSHTPLCVDKPGPQPYGSALTYARRYALSAIINVASEDDNDANDAQATVKSPAKSSQKPIESPKKTYKKAEPQTSPEREQVWKMLTDMHGSSAPETLCALTTWKDKTGKSVKGKKDISYVTEKQLGFLKGKIEKQWNEWKLKQQSNELPFHDEDELPF